MPAPTPTIAALAKVVTSRPAVMETEELAPIDVMLPDEMKLKQDDRRPAARLAS